MIELTVSTTGIYLLHFTPPYLHAGHYLGWAQDIGRRVEKHLAGHGSPLVAAVVAGGGAVELVRVWPGADRNEERRMKKTKAVGRLFCPRCRE